MLDTIKKQKLFFISLIGIVVVSLTMGVTYAYQSLVVKEASGSKIGMTVNVGVLDVTYTSTNRINLINMPLLKDYKTANYTEFELDNTKTTNNAAFQISLIDLEYSPELNTKDFKYTLVSISDGIEKRIVSGDFEGLTLNEFNLGRYNVLEKGIKQTYRLYLWLEETNENQNSLEKATFKGKINITSIFEDDMPKTFSQTIIYNAKRASKLSETTKTKYSTTLLSKPAAETALENEKLLLETEDDYTAFTDQNSYYFRGNVVDNYVNFAGMCWRIVRIEGDGSVKLILEDQFTTCNDSVDNDGDGIEDFAYTGNWNISAGNYGYVYEEDGIYKLNYSHPKSDDADQSMVKAFYDFQTERLIDYIPKLKIGNWCLGHKGYIRSGSSPYTYTPLNEIVDESALYYDSWVRLKGDSIEGYKPTMKCNTQKINSFESVLHNDIEIVKKAPMYVGTLTTDEVVYTGIIVGSTRYTTYLINNYQKDVYHFWTLSPSRFFSTYMDQIFFVRGMGNLGSLPVYDTDTQVAFRPVISLEESITVTTNSDFKTFGEPGTINNPYVVD